MMLFVRDESVILHVVITLFMTRHYLLNNSYVFLETKKISKFKNVLLLTFIL